MWIKDFITIICKGCYIFEKSLELFFLLPLAACSKKVFKWAWRRYYMQRLDKNIFNLCVQWLFYVGAKVNLSYTQINVLIFCLIWPFITISSIILNLILIFYWLSQKKLRLWNRTHWGKKLNTFIRLIHTIIFLILRWLWG